MTPMRIGASWARTSLLPRPTAATVAAEFLRSDLRDVIVVMVPPYELMAVMPQRLGQYLDNVRWSQRARHIGRRPRADCPIQNRLHIRATKSGCVLPASRCSAS